MFKIGSTAPSNRFRQWLKANMKQEQVTDTQTCASGTTTLTLVAYQTTLTTNGEAEDNVTVMPTGEFIGQRKVVVLGTRTHASDTVSFTITNIDSGLIKLMTAGSDTAFKLGTAAMNVMFEWTGAKWNIVYTTGTITT